MVEFKITISRGNLWFRVKRDNKEYEFAKNWLVDFPPNLIIPKLGEVEEEIKQLSTVDECRDLWRSFIKNLLG